jgi:rsbT co-antagonist protein RsbR
MQQQFQRWFADLPYGDPLQRRQAMLLQGMELGIAMAAILFLLQSVLTSGGRLDSSVLLLLLTMACAAGAIALLRGGRLQASALTMAGALIIVLTTLLYSSGYESGGVILFAYALPITMGGMLAGRQGIWLTVIACISGVALVITLTRLGVPGAGAGGSGEPASVTSIISFAVLAGLLGMFISSLNTLASEALAARKAREQELEALSANLERTVRERTRDLEGALGSLESRAAEAERLLTENARQREAIRTLSVPVLPLNQGTLVMPLVGELDSERLEEMQAQVLESIERLAARRLLLDITGVALIDTYVAQGLMQSVRAARLLGAEVALVGVRPEVAQAIVGLGIDFSLIRAYPDLESALR